MVACGLLTPTYGHMDNRPEGWPVDHMPTLRRSVPHKGCAFGLTRFACRTSIFRKEKGVRGRDLAPLRDRAGGRKEGAKGKLRPTAARCSLVPSLANPGRRSVVGRYRARTVGRNRLVPRS